MTTKELKEAILKEIDEQIIIGQEIVEKLKINLDIIPKVGISKEGKDKMQETLDERNKELIELATMRKLFKEIDDEESQDYNKQDNLIKLLILFQQKRITTEKQKLYIDEITRVGDELIAVKKLNNLLNK